MPAHVCTRKWTRCRPDFRAAGSARSSGHSGIRGAVFSDDLSMAGAASPATCTPAHGRRCRRVATSSWCATIRMASTACSPVCAGRPAADLRSVWHVSLPRLVRRSAAAARRCVPRGVARPGSDQSHLKQARTACTGTVAARAAARAAGSCAPTAETAGSASNCDLITPGNAPDSSAGLTAARRGGRHRAARAFDQLIALVQEEHVPQSSDKACCSAGSYNGRYVVLWGWYQASERSVARAIRTAGMVPAAGICSGSDETLTLPALFSVRRTRHGRPPGRQAHR